MNNLGPVFYYMSERDKLDLLFLPGTPSNPELNSDIKEVIDVISPVDAVTGNRENPITKLLSGSVSMLEKERILATLQQIPTSSRNDMSDEDLVALLPSRYHNTLTDYDFVGMKYKEFIDGVNDAQPVDNSTNVNPAE